MPSNIILVPLVGTEMETAALNTALALSGKISGHIRALFSRPDPERIVQSFQDGPYFGAHAAALLEGIQRHWDENSKAARKRFEKWRTANNLHTYYEANEETAPSTEWRELMGDEREILQDAGQLADVIVLARPGRNGSEFRDRVETALLQTGRPVVLAPPHARKDTGLNRVLIAWNRKPQAARAVSAALPLLRRASDVAVFTKPEGPLMVDAAEPLVEYLNWHGVPSTILADGKETGSTSHAVTAAAKRFSADLLVMGAYTHSRLRETIFGGVTRHIIEEAAMPVFLTH